MKKQLSSIVITSHLLQEIQKLAKHAKKEPQKVVEELLEFGLYSKVLFPREAIEFAKKLQRTLSVETKKNSASENTNQPVALLFEARLRTPAEILYSKKCDKSEEESV